MKRKSFYFIVFLILFFTSCKMYNYPNGAFTPVFTKSGDLVFDINSYTKQQVGYAITNNLGIFGTHVFQRYSGELAGGAEEYPRNHIEGNWYSLGVVPYYEIFENIYFETPVAIGRGNLYGRHQIYAKENYSNGINSTCNFITIQPTLSFNENKIINISLYDYNYISYNSVLESFYGGNSTESSIYNYMYNNQRFWSYINVLGGKILVGENHFKFFLDLSYITVAIPGDVYYKTFPYNIQTGFTLNFNCKKHNK